MAYSNGGGAFFIPYVIALLTTGIPLLGLEYYLGARFQRGPTLAFGKLRSGADAIGWFASFVALIVTVYYAIIMAWSWNYTYYSLGVKWAGDEKSFFFDTVLGISEDVSQFGGIRPALIFGNLLTWVVIYFIVRKGTESVSKVIKWTVFLPWFLLLVLIVRGVTLPGAGDGLRFYLNPDFSLLLDPNVWLNAYGQIFFSLSLGFGIMIAYASYLPKDADINTNAWTVALANSMTSFFAGFAVFSVLGYLALETGTEVSKTVTAGPGLAFVVYPSAIASLPGGIIIQSLFGVAFFLMLLCLGIDSAFSLVESAATGLWDAFAFDRKKLVRWLCMICFFAGIPFASGAGLYWLDIVDHWMNWGLIVVGFSEALLIGWFVKAREIEGNINASSKIKTSKFWFYSVKYWTPFVLFALLVTNIVKEIKTPYEGYPLWARLAGGWVPLAVLALIAVYWERRVARQHSK